MDDNINDDSALLKCLNKPVRQHAQHQDLEPAQLSSAIFHFIVYACTSPTVTRQNVVRKSHLVHRLVDFLCSITASRGVLFFRKSYKSSRLRVFFLFVCYGLCITFIVTKAC